MVVAISGDGSTHGPYVRSLKVSSGVAEGGRDHQPYLDFPKLLLGLDALMFT